MSGSSGPRALFAIAAGALVLVALACGGLAPGRPAVPTPTGQIGAIELPTADTPFGKADLEIWTGTITSQTSRHFVGGSQLTDCETDWVTDLEFTVDPVGEVAGKGEARLSAPRTCTATGNIVDNVQSESIDIKGLKETTGFQLSLIHTGFEPSGTGDFGGLVLLYTDGTCPGEPREISVPLTGKTTAEAQLDLSATMTGCGGSASDTMANQSLIKLEYLFKCSELPADNTDETLKGLCQ
jgi:hypothetical protein